MKKFNEFPQLGFGILRLPVVDNKIDIVKTQSMIDEYMKGSFCYFDMHINYMQGQAESLVRELVVKRYSRESFLLADKVPIYVQSSSDYEKYFRGSLKSCGVSYFDCYLLHAITREVYEKHERLGGFAFLQKLKEQGEVRHIGFSFHDKPDLLDEILTKHPEIDFVQLQINYLDWESPVICARECYEIARKHNKPIFVMEPIKGGSLANKIDSMEENTELKNLNLAEVALQFVASLPGISVILSGMSEVEHVIQNRKVLEKSTALNECNQKIIELLREKIAQDNKIQCTACRYCIEECPQKIPISDIFSLLNAYENIKGKGKLCQQSVYNGIISGKGTAGSCIQCGKCETLCPQKLSIREHLKQAAKLFDKTPLAVRLERATYRYQTLRNWMTVLQSENTLELFFTANGYKNIAVYGIGEIGVLLLKEIKRYKTVYIEYGIDKKANLLIQDISIVEPDAILKEVDAIVVTPTFDFENIEKQLSEKVKCPIVSLDEVIDWCLQ